MRCLNSSTRFERRYLVTAKYVAAVDQGTTSTRCMIFNHFGQVVSVDQTEHSQIYLKPGWVEHDPLEIWQRKQDVIRGAVKKTGVRSGDLAAVGVTNQRETTVVWDKNTGEPYYNAIVWQYTRLSRFAISWRVTVGEIDSAE